MKYRDSKLVKPLSMNYFEVAQLGGSVCTAGIEKSSFNDKICDENRTQKTTKTKQ